MATSQNGYTVPTLSPRVWRVPGTDVTIPLRGGAAGFVLIHLALWFHEKIEPLTGPVRDDWGIALRTIRGDETDLSNHASGTATDLNATRHVLGRRGTFKVWQYVKIKARLAIAYRLVIRSGAYYHVRADEMHWEINAGTVRLERLARRLVKTPRGRRILAANKMSAHDAWQVRP